MRGLLIAFQGLDKTGKTTQCRLLQSYLSGKGVKNNLIHFPVRNSVTGQVINRYLTNQLDLLPQTSHLLFSSNRWEMYTRIVKMLEQQELVILDRYIWSGKAYSLALGLEEEWVDMPDRGLPRPDLTFYMRSSSRLDSVQARQRYENKTFQLKVSEQYQRILRNSKNWGRLQTINSDQPLELNHEKIRSVVDSLR